MQEYDPEKTPNPKEWLALDEWECTNLIVDYHDSAEVELPNPQLHAIFHTIVENQIAMGEKVAIRTLRCLMKEGLNRVGWINSIRFALYALILEMFTCISLSVQLRIDDHQYPEREYVID